MQQAPSRKHSPHPIAMANSERCRVCGRPLAASCPAVEAQRATATEGRCGISNSANNGCVMLCANNGCVTERYYHHRAHNITPHAMLWPKAHVRLLNMLCIVLWPCPIIFQSFSSNHQIQDHQLCPTVFTKPTTWCSQADRLVLRDSQTLK